ncbi:MAG TPA: trypsin-like peptidase domain-containing protein, partial [Lacipirellulaceae bacterium]|nr:trypsin-like peptidase domain-containing protein [Lacipirellulaceae bacterium]
DGGQKKSDAAAAKTVDEVEAEAAACRTAKQAVLIYKFYLASSNLPADKREAASANMKEWEKKAAEDQVRLGKQWMTKDEADKIHKQARAKVEQAMEALHLNNGDLARKTLEDASRLDPDSIQADFMMGIVYGAIAKNDKKAEICFEKCLKREPDNVSVLNNLAVTMAMQKKYHEAAMNWKTAASSAPKMPGLTQNIGNVIALAGSGKMKVPDKTLQELNEVYDDLVVKHGNPRPTEGGFVFTPPYGAEWNKNGGESSGKKDSVIVSSGSGFVIAPHVILTNRHVVKGATGLLVLDPKKPHGEPLEAELIAESENPDLALVRCKSLDAPAVKFADKLPPRGTDIMVLGFPLGPGFGTTLKSTRGAMVAMPDPALDNMFLYDAITNPGNSGGPLCDKSGHVAGVVRAVTGSVGGTYGAGIPIVDALPFIHQHVPELSVNTGAEKEIDWPAVDALVSPSTVLIMTKEDVRTDAGISVKSGK